MLNRMFSKSSPVPSSTSVRMREKDFPNGSSAEKDLVIVFAEQLAVGFRHVFNLLVIAFRNFVAHVAEMFGHNQHVVAVDFRRNHFPTLRIGEVVASPT